IRIGGLFLGGLFLGRCLFGGCFFLRLGLGIRAFALFQSRAQNVAQRCAGFGRAVFLHRLLVFVDFAGFDGQRQLACLGIDADDFRVDFLAHGETVGALLGAFARQVSLLDRAFYFVINIHFNIGLADFGYRTGDNVALLVAIG